MKLCCFYVNSMNTSQCIWSPWKKQPLQLGLQDQQVGRSAPPKTESCRLAQWPKSPKWQENHHGNRSNNTELYRTVQNITESLFYLGSPRDLMRFVEPRTNARIGDLIRKDMAWHGDTTKIGMLRMLHDLPSSLTPNWTRSWGQHSKSSQPQKCPN